jgi:low affinity Fe/Cu permease
MDVGNANRLFSRFAQRVSHWSGRSPTFLLAILVIIAWAASGPLFHFSDTWQLVINTGTTIVTFLMVFLIQNTQNRDTEAIQLKLDELIKATAHARDGMLNLEDLSEQELDRLRAGFVRLAEHRPEARDEPCDAPEEPAARGR